MSQVPESSFQEHGEGPSFLARVGIVFVVLTAGISLAVLVAAA